jgi:hypothetical protein
VARWCRCGLSVSGPFVRRCLTSLTMLPFPSGNGADFLLVLNSRTLEEPMHEAKQMMTGQPVGAASHTTGGFSTVVRIGSKSVSSRSDSF